MQLSPEDEKKKLEAEWKRASAVGNSQARRQAIRTWAGIFLAGLVGLLYLLGRAGRRR